MLFILSLSWCAFLLAPVDAHVFGRQSDSSAAEFSSSTRAPLRQNDVLLDSISQSAGSDSVRVQVRGRSGQRSSLRQHGSEPELWLMRPPASETLQAAPEAFASGSDYAASGFVMAGAPSTLYVQYNFDGTLSVKVRVLSMPATETSPQAPSTSSDASAPTSSENATAYRSAVVASSIQTTSRHAVAAQILLLNPRLDAVCAQGEPIHISSVVNATSPIAISLGPTPSNIILYVCASVTEIFPRMPSMLVDADGRHRMATITQGGRQPTRQGFSVLPVGSGDGAVVPVPSIVLPPWVQAVVSGVLQRPQATAVAVGVGCDEHTPQRIQQLALVDEYELFVKDGAAPPEVTVCCGEVECGRQAGELAGNAPAPGFIAEYLVVIVAAAVVGLLVCVVGLGIAFWLWRRGKHKRFRYVIPMDSVYIAPLRAGRDDLALLHSSQPGAEEEGEVDCVEDEASEQDGDADVGFGMWGAQPSECGEQDEWVEVDGVVVGRSRSGSIMSFAAGPPPGMSLSRRGSVLSQSGRPRSGSVMSVSRRGSFAEGAGSFSNLPQRVGDTPHFWTSDVPETGAEPPAAGVPVILFQAPDDPDVLPPSASASDATSAANEATAKKSKKKAKKDLTAGPNLARRRSIPAAEPFAQPSSDDGSGSDVSEEGPVDLSAVAGLGVDAMASRLQISCEPLDGMDRTAKELMRAASDLQAQKKALGGANWSNEGLALASVARAAATVVIARQKMESGASSSDDSDMDGQPKGTKERYLRKVKGALEGLQESDDFTLKGAAEEIIKEEYNRVLRDEAEFNGGGAISPLNILHEGHIKDRKRMASKLPSLNRPKVSESDDGGSSDSSSSGTGSAPSPAAETASVSAVSPSPAEPTTSVLRDEYAKMLSELDEMVPGSGGEGEAASAAAPSAPTPSPVVIPDDPIDNAPLLENTVVAADAEEDDILKLGLQRLRDAMAAAGLEGAEEDRELAGQTVPARLLALRSVAYMRPCICRPLLQALDILVTVRERRRNGKAGVRGFATEAVPLASIEELHARIVPVIADRPSQDPPSELAEIVGETFIEALQSSIDHEREIATAEDAAVAATATAIEKSSRKHAKKKVKADGDALRAAANAMRMVHALRVGVRYVDAGPSPAPFDGGVERIAAVIRVEKALAAAGDPNLQVGGRARGAAAQSIATLERLLPDALSNVSKAQQEVARDILRAEYGVVSGWVNSARGVAEDMEKSGGAAATVAGIKALVDTFSRVMAGDPKINVVDDVWQLATILGEAEEEEDGSVAGISAADLPAVRMLLTSLPLDEEQHPELTALVGVRNMLSSSTTPLEGPGAQAAALLRDVIDVSRRRLREDVENEQAPLSWADATALHQLSDTLGAFTEGNAAEEVVEAFTGIADKEVEAIHQVASAELSTNEAETKRIAKGVARPLIKAAADPRVLVFVAPLEALLSARVRRTADLDQNPEADACALVPVVDLLRLGVLVDQLQNADINWNLPNQLRSIKPGPVDALARALSSERDLYVHDTMQAVWLSRRLRAEASKIGQRKVKMPEGTDILELVTDLRGQATALEAMVELRRKRRRMADCRNVELCSVLAEMTLPRERVSKLLDVVDALDGDMYEELDAYADIPLKSIEGVQRCVDGETGAIDVLECMDDEDAEESTHAFARLRKSQRSAKGPPRAVQAAEEHVRRAQAAVAAAHAQMLREKIASKKLKGDESVVSKRTSKRLTDALESVSDAVAYAKSQRTQAKVPLQVLRADIPSSSASVEEVREFLDTAEGLPVVVPGGDEAVADDDDDSPAPPGETGGPAMVPAAAAVAAAEEAVAEAPQVGADDAFGVDDGDLEYTEVSTATVLDALLRGEAARFGAVNLIDTWRMERLEALSQFVVQLSTAAHALCAPIEKAALDVNAKDWVEERAVVARKLDVLLNTMDRLRDSFAIHLQQVSEGGVEHVSEGANALASTGGAVATGLIIRWEGPDCADPRVPVDGSAGVVKTFVGRLLTHARAVDQSARSVFARQTMERAVLTVSLDSLARADTVEFLTQLRRLFCGFLDDCGMLLVSHGTRSDDVEALVRAGLQLESSARSFGSAVGEDLTGGWAECSLASHQLEAVVVSTRAQDRHTLLNEEADTLVDESLDAVLSKIEERREERVNSESSVGLSHMHALQRTAKERASILEARGVAAVNELADALNDGWNALSVGLEKKSLSDDDTDTMHEVVRVTIEDVTTVATWYLNGIKAAARDVLQPSAYAALRPLSVLRSSAAEADEDFDDLAAVTMLAGVLGATALKLMSAVSELTASDAEFIATPAGGIAPAAIVDALKARAPPLEALLQAVNAMTLPVAAYVASTGASGQQAWVMNESKALNGVQAAWQHAIDNLGVNVSVLGEEWAEQLSDEDVRQKLSTFKDVLQARFTQLESIRLMCEAAKERSRQLISQMNSAVDAAKRDVKAAAVELSKDESDPGAIAGQRRAEEKVAHREALLASLQREARLMLLGDVVNVGASAAPQFAEDAAKIDAVFERRRAGEDGPMLRALMDRWQKALRVGQFLAEDAVAGTPSARGPPTGARKKVKAKAKAKAKGKKGRNAAADLDELAGFAAAASPTSTAGGEDGSVSPPTASKKKKKVGGKKGTKQAIDIDAVDSAAAVEGEGAGGDEGGEAEAEAAGGMPSLVVTGDGGDVAPQAASPKKRGKKKIEKTVSVARLEDAQLTEAQRTVVEFIKAVQAEQSADRQTLVDSGSASVKNEISQRIAVRAKLIPLLEVQLLDGLPGPENDPMLRGAQPREWVGELVSMKKNEIDILNRMVEAKAARSMNSIELRASVHEAAESTLEALQSEAEFAQRVADKAILQIIDLQKILDEDLALSKESAEWAALTPALEDELTLQHRFAGRATSLAKKPPALFSTRSAVAKGLKAVVNIVSPANRGRIESELRLAEQRLGTARRSGPPRNAIRYAQQLISQAAAEGTADADAVKAEKAAEEAHSDEEPVPKGGAVGGEGGGEDSDEEKTLRRPMVVPQTVIRGVSKARLLIAERVKERRASIALPYGSGLDVRIGVEEKKAQEEAAAAAAAAAAGDGGGAPDEESESVARGNRLREMMGQDIPQVTVEDTTAPPADERKEEEGVGSVEESASAVARTQSSPDAGDTTTAGAGKGTGDVDADPADDVPAATADRDDDDALGSDLANVKGGADAISSLIGGGGSDDDLAPTGPLRATKSAAPPIFDADGSPKALKRSGTKSPKASPKSPPPSSSPSGAVGGGDGSGKDVVSEPPKGAKPTGRRAKSNAKPPPTTEMFGTPAAVGTLEEANSLTAELDALLDLATGPPQLSRNASGAVVDEDDV